MNAGAKSLRPRVALVIGGTAYVLAMAALATWAAWPIYRSTALLLVAAAGTVAGLLLAVLMVLLGEVVAPPLEKYARQLKVFSRAR